MNSLNKTVSTLATLVALCAVACSVAEPEHRIFDLEIKDMKLSMDKIKVNHGDTVTLNMKSDVLGDFHLHGYNHHADLEPGTASDMKFIADATGNFVIMLHLYSADEDSDYREDEHDKQQSDHKGHPDDETDKHKSDQEAEHTEEEMEVQLATLEVHPR